MEKTISSLNTKTWYRALKVFYFALFIILFIIYNFYILSNDFGGFKEPAAQKSQTNSTIHTAQHIPDTSNTQTTLTPELQRQLQAIANGTSDGLNTNQAATPVSPAGIPNAHVNYYQQWQDQQVAESNHQSITMVFNKDKFIKFAIIGNLLIILAFELFRRLFYYIFLGKFRPKDSI